MNPPEQKIGKLLTERNLTLAVAESCTGGLISHRITNIPGSSNYFERGVVVYSNRAKTELLGIEGKVIGAYGAVSAEVARAMAAGAKEAARTDFGLAVTGIAGPVSDESKKPVGLVYIAVCAPDGSLQDKKYNFHGTRLQIKKQSADAALELLLKMLRCQ
ncbi:MAG: CinA family protein [Candidatus Lindowbacteria bacterium]|nr:CinA family protein [Candidatus Lindowbacteria bacterium]